MVFENLLNCNLGGNTGNEISLALMMFIALFFIFWIVDKFLLKFLQKATKKTKVTWDDAIIDFFEGIKMPFFAFIAFYISAKTLVLPDIANSLLRYLLVIFVAFYITKGIVQIVESQTQREIKRRTLDENKQDTSMLRVLSVIIKFLIWIVAFLMVLANFGIEITPLIAGLGVGGIAIALALQTILGDLFSAFAIYLDKPFQEGDFIIVGGDKGIVKHIGIKTTRLTTLQGEELVISNSELTSTRINNYKRMEKRRIIFEFGVTYNTPVTKLKKINKIIEKIIKDEKLAELDRVHFKEFGDFSLNYEVVFYVSTSEYSKYMDIQQRINFQLKEIFEKEKIEFAFPTQTIQLEK